MARLVAVSNAWLADGFRLAGIPTATTEPDHVDATLRSLVDDPDVGLILVTRDLWDAAAERTRGAIEALPSPLVLAVPAGEITETGARRELLGEMLERAIGYRIELGNVER